MTSTRNEISVMLFKSRKAWTTWLEKNHAKSAGI
jgi:uncharacterized protein YdeI (YjbR/CyaY-like superfamily)